MTSKERIAKINQAKDLLREVEFSYPHGNNIRQMLFKIVASNFSLLGEMPTIIKLIENEEQNETI